MPVRRGGHVRPLPFASGETSVLARETRNRHNRGHMVETQTEWPLLSHFDALTIKSDPQLATITKKGCSLSRTRCGQRDSAIDERQGPLTRRSRHPQERAVAGVGEYVRRV
jgi:hypothetical protein